MSLTEQQRRAVEATGSVAVTAGAGTGKTHMLTERYLHHLEAHGLRPLEIVAGTFTEAAAAELRGRVRARLRQLPQLGHLAGELEAAQIGTLHSLAGRICREHPEAAGVPWDFAVQDELNQRLWLERHLREALLALPEELASALPFDVLRDSLRALLADPYTARTALAADPRQWPELIEAQKQIACRRMTKLRQWREAVATLEANAGPVGDKLELQRREALEAVRRIEAGDFSTEVCTILDGLSKRPGSAKAWGDAVALVKEACGVVRDCYRRFGRIFGLALGPADDRLRELLPPLAQAYRLVDAHLAEVKRKERLLDFSDLELHALRALQYAAVRGFYRSRWKAFLVDEFQDTNPVQAELLARLTGMPLAAGGRYGGDREAAGTIGPDASTSERHRTAPRVTVVGDEKQSIYGFRRADIDVFRQVREAIDGAGGETIELSTSFRTHHELMAPLNAVFEPALAELHQPLAGARTDGPGDAPYLSVRLVVSEGRVLKQFRQRAEAHHIGELIAELIADGAPVFDKASRELRPVRPGDIAILARTWDTLSPYAEELAARGVPTIHAGGGDLLAQREVKDALALLRFLADPTDDLSLAAVLRSPFFALEDRRLVELAAEARGAGTSWWATLAQHRSGRQRDSDPFALAERNDDPGELSPASLGVAASTLDALLTLRREAPSRLLRRADDLTGYTAVIGNMPGGQRRLADWRGFCDFVAQLERGQEDVFTVVRELRLLTGLSDVKVPRPGMEAGDAVSLMSVHNAKGLEWPIVVVPDVTAGTFARGSATLFEAAAGLAFEVEDDSGEKVEPALFSILDARRKAREAEEELRILYVALTRARDRIVLSGSHEKGGRLASLEEGLEAAGVEPILIPFDPAHAVPKTPRPENAAEQGERVLGGAGVGLFELPVTSLSTFAECPQRFYFEQILQHPGAGQATSGPEWAGSTEGDRHEAGTAVAARIGELTHRALQFAIEDEGELASLDPSLELEHVRSSLGFARAFRNSPVFAPLRDAIVRRELPLVIDGGEYGSRLRLHGIADAVGVDFVLDYKTGARDRESHLLQVAVYARALGLERAFVAYLRDTELVGYSAAELDSAHSRLGEILRAIEAGAFEASPAYEKCRRCPFEPLCESSAMRHVAPKEVQTTTK